MEEGSGGATAVVSGVSIHWADNEVEGQYQRVDPEAQIMDPWRQKAL